MPSARVEFIIKSDRIMEFYEQLHKEIVGAVVETAKEAEGDGQNGCPVKSGFMKSSYYVDAEGYSDYGKAGSPPAGAELLPAEHHEKDTQAIVGIAASYGIYVEMGTSKMSAQPSLVPAVEAARATLLNKLSEIDGKLQ